MASGTQDGGRPEENRENQLHQQGSHDPKEPIEIYDRLGPENARKIIRESILVADAQEVQAEVWRKRKEKTLHEVAVCISNLDYDLERLGIPV